MWTKNIELKGEIDKSTITVRDVNIRFSTIDRTLDKKSSRLLMNSTTPSNYESNPYYRTFYSTVEYTVTFNLIRSIYLKKLKANAILISERLNAFFLRLRTMQECPPSLLLLSIVLEILTSIVRPMISPIYPLADHRYMSKPSQGQLDQKNCIGEHSLNCLPAESWAK